MNILKKIFKNKETQEDKPPERLKITLENIDNWPNFYEVFQNGKIKADSTGKLRYLHGAPVGELVLVRINKDGKAIYKETRSEWFDPESPKASRFVWP